LLQLAETRRLAGPIDVLGQLRRWEALPCLVAALADDVARPVAEQAIRQFGQEAVPALMAGARERAIQDGSESDSSLRRRRAALALLLEVADRLCDLPSPSQWVGDDDADIAVLGCRLVLRSGNPEVRQPALRKLIDLYSIVSGRLRWEIEDGLAACSEDARLLLRDRMPAALPAEDDRSADAERKRSLLRLARRLGL
jgi:hypothetical protein